MNRMLLAILLLSTAMAVYTTTEIASGYRGIGSIDISGNTLLIAEKDNSQVTALNAITYSETAVEQVNNVQSVSAVGSAVYAGTTTGVRKYSWTGSAFNYLEQFSTNSHITTDVAQLGSYTYVLVTETPSQGRIIRYDYLGTADPFGNVVNTMRNPKELATYSGMNLVLDEASSSIYSFSYSTEGRNFASFAKISTSETLSAPKGMAVLTDGSLAVADSGSKRIVKLVYTGSVLQKADEITLSFTPVDVVQYGNILFVASANAVYAIEQTDVDISYTPAPPVESQATQFEAIMKGIGPSATVTWDINGVKLSGTKVSHTFSKAGTYTAKVTVVEGGKEVASDSVTVSVTTKSAAPSAKPYASIISETCSKLSAWCECTGKECMDACASVAKKSGLPATTFDSGCVIALPSEKYDCEEVASGMPGFTKKTCSEVLEYCAKLTGAETYKRVGFKTEEEQRDATNYVIVLIAALSFVVLAAHFIAKK
ncbi:MAG: PKD domain-containing protein [Candidatus Diapherotrites archaeon]|nr:PKD domain-containing protein [Candidatus Diapherotrites archaeon]